MNVLKKLNRCLLVLSKWVSIAAFVIMLAAASLQIVMRFIFKAPLAWTDEVARYCFIWATMLGCAYLVSAGGHSSVEILQDRLSGKKKVMHRLLIEGLCLIFYAIVIRGGITLTQAGATTRSVACGFPMALIYGIVPLSGAFMFLFQLEHILEDARGAGRQDKEVKQ